MEFAALVVYCIDVGSISEGNFGWARTDASGASMEEHRGGSEIADVANAVADDLSLIASARKQLGFERPAIADAWLWSTAALAHATARDERAALAALEHSMTTLQTRPTDGSPPWPWIFAFDFPKVAAQQLTCAVRLRRPDLAFHAARSARDLLAAPTKQAALWQLDHAEACLQHGDVDAAFRIAAGVLHIAENQHSVRLKERARNLRRTYTGDHRASAVRDFDERFRALAV